jgi:imidazolonepropionase-like amidohydrolase
MKLLNSLFLCLLLLLSFSIMSQSVTIIHAGTLFAIPGEGVSKEKTLVIENGMITKIENGYLYPADFGYLNENAKLVDLKNSFVMPGLIDMHVHITGELDYTGNPYEWITLNDEDNAYNAIPYLERTINAGFTTVRDLGARYTLINSIKRAVQKKLIVGPRILAATNSISATGGHGDEHGYRPDIMHALPHNPAICDGADECRKAVRSLVMKHGADVIKLNATGGVLSNTASGLGQQMTDEELRTIVETSHSLGKKVAAHAHGADGINAALRAGVNSIEHGSYLDDESVRLFNKTGAYLVPTLLAGVSVIEGLSSNNTMPPAIVEKARNVAPIVEASFKRALKGNVNIAFGTDCGVGKHGDNAREFQLMVKYGMKNEAALKSSTVNAADLLGMYDKIGSLEVGKYADIIAVEGNPLLDINAMFDVRFVMKEGDIIKQ